VLALDPQHLLILGSVVFNILFSVKFPVDKNYNTCISVMQYD